MMLSYCSRDRGDIWQRCECREMGGDSNRGCQDRYRLFQQYCCVVVESVAIIFDATRNVIVSTVIVIGDTVSIRVVDVRHEFVVPHMMWLLSSMQGWKWVPQEILLCITLDK